MRARLLSLTSLAALAAFAAACGSKKKETPPAVDPAKTTATASATASGAPGDSPPEPEVKPACTTSGQKVWTKGANQLAGLTAEELSDGTDVIGLAIGNTPYVLVVEPQGGGSLKKVTIDPGSAFGKAPKPAEGTRQIWRVTPVKMDAKSVRAFVDFRDELKDTHLPATAGPTKLRRVVCGPADTTARWVAWEGPNFLDEPKLAKDPLPALEEAHLLGAGKEYREVRDCRTFYDPKRDEEWVVNSQISITKEGAEVKAKSTLVISTPSTNADVHTTQLSAKPWKRLDYEVPISDELGDGSYFVAARAGTGSLVANVLTHDKKPRGAPKSYPGFFQMPDLARDGADDVLVAAQASAKGGLTLRGMRITGDTLPAAFANVTNENDEAHSASRPEFLRDAKGQRWIAYLENVEKGHGVLEVMPITAAFRSAGKAYAVTKDDEKASEARLFAKKGGGFIVVYIREGGELVSEDLDCKVEK